MSSVRAIALVARREIGAWLRSRAVLAVTVVLVGAAVGMVLLVHHFARSQQDAPQLVGVTAPAASYEQMLVDAGRVAGQRIEIVPIDPISGESRVRSGELAALFTGVTDGRLQVVVKSGLPNGLRTAFTVLARQIALNQQISALGGNQVAVQHAISATVNSRELQPVDEDRAVRVGIASIAGLLTYIMVLIGMQLVGQGVVQEKTGHIAELLLATIRPWELLAGRVFGIGALILGQVAVIAMAGAGTASALGVVHLPPAALASVAGWTVLWCVLGYLLYALVMAVTAVLVSQREELASAAAPVSVVLVAAGLIGQAIVPGDPNSVVTVVISMIPPLSPVVLPMRAVYGVPGWQMAVSVVLTMLTIGVVARLAGRVYGTAILHTGSRMSLRTALVRARAIPAAAVEMKSPNLPDRDEESAGEPMTSTVELHV